ncbi:DUF2169 family type VI secretion system accessory protein [Aquabacterium humicola]|uniref:DUF2169 family type VI secretion system accessory protein n=1 Tax=Aquabacterium humicola TaxID=3237377 RepID=UPI0025437697|nr:DUF2169 domain-containing protein [Rubrivivax pictus]
MLQVDNQTPFGAALSVFPDVRGVETAYLVLKATFQFASRGPKLAEKQIPLLAADVFWGDPQSTSLRAGGDFAPSKPATDVLLVGRAIAQTPGTRVADVRLRVGPVAKVVRVFGDRRWERSGQTLVPSAPQPWERVPLRWEYAFGGIAAAAPGQDPSQREHEPHNPVGRGVAGPDPMALAGQLLPNLEDPAAPIASPQDRPRPAGFAPVAPSWMPRRAYAGTYDAAWQRERAPYLPLDFDPRYFQLAPAGLVAPGHLQGGEPVELDGFTLGGPLRFTLPQLTLDTDFHFDGRWQPRPPLLETVLFEPDQGRFQMLWRAALPVDKKLLRLAEVRVRCAEHGSDGRPPPPLASLQSLPPAYAEAR